MLVEHMETMLGAMDVAELDKTYLCDLISLKYVVSITQDFS